ncbi:mCG146086, partial [Mus musculus]
SSICFIGKVQRRNCHAEGYLLVGVHMLFGGIHWTHKTLSKDMALGCSPASNLCSTLDFLPGAGVVSTQHHAQPFLLVKVGREASEWLWPRGRWGSCAQCQRRRASLSEVRRTRTEKTGSRQGGALKLGKGS